MSAGFAVVTESAGVTVRRADVNGFSLTELAFPPGYAHGEVEPELPYVAVVLEGAMSKSFRRRTLQLGRGCAVTMPSGATHGARFGAAGARVVVVKATSESSAPCLKELGELRGAGFSRLACRLAAELRASDAAAPLAAEGLALELLAAASRESRTTFRVERVPSWLRSAEELLRARRGAFVSLGELAGEVGVHPTHLARVFRGRYGVSVGEYGRRLRLEWAAEELARTDTPLAIIATQAGFADQSHFTRLFRRYVGATPSQYREETHTTRRH